MRKYRKLLSAVLMTLVVVAFMGFPTAAFAADKAPVLDDASFWVDEPLAAISISGISINDDQVTSITSSDPSVLAVRKDAEGMSYGYSLYPKKKGKATLTVRLAADDETFILKHTYVVKNYPQCIKKLKVNGKKVKVTKKKNPYIKGYKNYKKTTAKIKLDPKKGWKVRHVVYTMANQNDQYTFHDVKGSLKKTIKIKYPKNCKQLSVIYVLENKKTKDAFTYAVDFDR